MLPRLALRRFQNLLAVPSSAGQKRDKNDVPDSHVHASYRFNGGGWGGAL
jgi:hypothetical protein